MNQFILFDDNGKISDVYFTNSVVIDGNNALWDCGAAYGIGINFGLLEGGSVNVGDVLTASQSLLIVQNTKIAQLNKSCQDTIFNGFDCVPDTTTGISYHFPFDTTAQDNYSQYLIDVLSGSTANEDWKVMDSSGNWLTLNITADNFQANVRPVASSFKKSQINQYRALVTNVQNAQDITSVKAISWSPASY